MAPYRAEEIAMLRIFLVVFLLSLVGAVQGFAKEDPPSFSPLRGTYTGTLSVAATYEAFSAPVALTIKVTKKGQGAIMTLTSDTGFVPVRTVYTFGKKGKLTVQGLITQFEPEVATGKYKLTDSKLKFTAAIADPVLPRSVQATVRFKGKSLKMTGVLFETIAPGQVNSGTLVITARKK